MKTLLFGNKVVLSNKKVHRAYAFPTERHVAYVTFDEYNFPVLMEPALLCFTLRLSHVRRQ